MQDRMKYVNHLGETVQFGKDNTSIDENDFRDYKWSYSTQYGRVVHFNKAPTVKKLPVTIYGEKFTENKNNIFEVIERDVLAEEKGKLFIGEYYVTGYFFASSKSGYTSNYATGITLQFVTDEAWWKKENLYTYRLKDANPNDRGLGYAYGYPYDYLSASNTQNLYNPSGAGANFILTIYGPIMEPSVTIGANTYRVETDVLTNEFLAVNSIKKTVIRTTAKGIKINEFANRGQDNYIFQKIAPGINAVSMAASCNFDIAVIEERSEPKWT